jgi:hypothetical protein
MPLLLPRHQRRKRISQTWLPSSRATPWPGPSWMPRRSPSQRPTLRPATPSCCEWWCTVPWCAPLWPAVCRPPIALCPAPPARPRALDTQPCLIDCGPHVHAPPPLLHHLPPRHSPTEAAIAAFLKEMNLSADDLKKRPQLAKRLVAQHLILRSNGEGTRVVSRGEGDTPGGILCVCCLTPACLPA